MLWCAACIWGAEPSLSIFRQADRHENYKMPVNFRYVSSAKESVMPEI